MIARGKGVTDWSKFNKQSSTSGEEGQTVTNKFSTNNALSSVTPSAPQLPAQVKTVASPAKVELPSADFSGLFDLKKAATDGEIPSPVQRGKQNNQIQIGADGTFSKAQDGTQSGSTNGAEISTLSAPANLSLASDVAAKQAKQAQGGNKQLFAPPVQDDDADNFESLSMEFHATITQIAENLTSATASASQSQIHSEAEGGLGAPGGPQAQGGSLTPDLFSNLTIDMTVPIKIRANEVSDTTPHDISDIETVEVPLGLVLECRELLMNSIQKKVLSFNKKKGANSNKPEVELSSPELLAEAIHQRFALTTSGSGSAGSSASSTPNLKYAQAVGTSTYSSFNRPGSRNSNVNPLHHPSSLSTLQLNLDTTIESKNLGAEYTDFLFETITQLVYWWDRKDPVRAHAYGMKMSTMEAASLQNHNAINGENSQHCTLQNPLGLTPDDEGRFGDAIRKKEAKYGKMTRKLNREEVVYQSVGVEVETPRMMGFGNGGDGISSFGSTPTDANGDVTQKGSGYGHGKLNSSVSSTTAGSTGSGSREQVHSLPQPAQAAHGHLGQRPIFRRPRGIDVSRLQTLKRAAEITGHRELLAIVMKTMDSLRTENCARITKAELDRHANRKSCWVVIDRKVSLNNVTGIGMSLREVLVELEVVDS